MGSGARRFKLEAGKFLCLPFEPYTMTWIMMVAICQSAFDRGHAAASDAASHRAARNDGTALQPHARRRRSAPHWRPARASRRPDVSVRDCPDRMVAPGIG